MKKALVFLISLLFIFPAYVDANPYDKTDETLKTRMDKLSIKTGVVIIRGFEKIGTIQGQFGTSIAIDAKEFTNVATGKREYGILITVKEEKGHYDRKDASYVDYNEIDSLLSGIKYISKINKSATKFASFQADYKTNGGLGISNFSAQDGTMIAVSSGRIGSSSAYFNISELSKIEHLIQEAKTKIGELKSTD